MSRTGKKNSSETIYGVTQQSMFSQLPDQAEGRKQPLIWVLHDETVSGTSLANCFLEGEL